MRRNGIDSLFPAQSATFKLVVDGKDLIVKSRTGSGKTLAFLLPMEELINRETKKWGPNESIKAIILEPTRELAKQVQV